MQNSLYNYFMEDTEVKGIPEPEEGQGEKAQSERIVMKPVDEKKTAEDTESADFGNNGGEDGGKTGENPDVPTV